MIPQIDQQISRQFTQVILSGLQEYIGRSSLATLSERSQVAILNLADQPKEPAGGLRYSEISKLQIGLEEIYGMQAARGVALRSGRAALCYLLHEFDEESDFNQLEFRLMPPRKRMLAGLERIAALVGREVAQAIQIDSNDKAWTWQIEVCPECWGRTNPAAMCYFTVGLLQEFLSWLSGGRIYLVEEVACRAKGDPSCLIRIDKKPLD